MPLLAPGNGAREAAPPPWPREVSELVRPRVTVCAPSTPHCAPGSNVRLPHADAGPTMPTWKKGSEGARRGARRAPRRSREGGNEEGGEGAGARERGLSRWSREEGSEGAREPPFPRRPRRSREEGRRGGGWEKDDHMCSNSISLAQLRSVGLAILAMAPHSQRTGRRSSVPVICGATPSLPSSLAPSLPRSAHRGRAGQSHDGPACVPRHAACAGRRGAGDASGAGARPWG